MSDQAPWRKVGRSDDLETFASSVDEHLAQSTSSLPGSDALDPTLWSKIRGDTRGDSPNRESAPEWATLESGRRAERRSGRSASPSVSQTNWRRGTAAFLVVATVLTVMMILPGNSVEPQYGTTILEAPQALTPIPGLEEGCSVEPLASEQVLEMVLDPGRVGWVDDRALFATPPPSIFEYSHTQTWLPESNGAVDMAGGQRQVRTPTAAEFHDSRLALDLYLRCQEEGTNYQLWALESPLEVQRQILTQTLADDERGWEEIRSRGLEDVTETLILETIERIGPQPRMADGYLLFSAPDGLVLEVNPTRTKALVAENPAKVGVEYAWIATQWVDPATGEVVSTRGAALDAGPTRAEDGSMPNLVVMILKFDAERDQWLVEWFVPTI